MKQPINAHGKDDGASCQGGSWSAVERGGEHHATASLAQAQLPALSCWGNLLADLRVPPPGDRQNPLGGWDGPSSIDR